MSLDLSAQVERIGTTIYTMVDHVLVPLFSHHSEPRTVPEEDYDEKARRLDRLVACWNACQGVPTADLTPGYFETMRAAAADAVADAIISKIIREAACVRACQGISTEALNAGVLRDVQQHLALLASGQDTVMSNAEALNAMSAE